MLGATTRPALALALVLLAAGRVGERTAGEGEGRDEAADDGSSSEQTGIDSDSRSFLINLGGPSAGPVPAAFDMGEIEIDENATGVLVEARWSCASPTCALGVVLVGPEGSEVGRAPGEGEASFFVASPAAGTYRFGVQTAQDPVVNARGHVASFRVLRQRVARRLQRPSGGGRGPRSLTMRTGEPHTGHSGASFSR